ncbi:hypothetical protein [Luteimonas kalidii]|uniref:Uncharacterized protein n=1 Tax=Luteimonas kalidii TaxID=3042025 RepID=A0ABT6JQD8_9GAMM|nr:hypothetical protein [Luteimonas kalidii]MDH5832901.1 hypothetical protein [Luteimonas kalidii]
MSRGHLSHSAPGHEAKTCRDPPHLQMIDGAIGWAAGTPRDTCE